VMASFALVGFFSAVPAYPALFLRTPFKPCVQFSHTRVSNVVGCNVISSGSWLDACFTLSSRLIVNWTRLKAPSPSPCLIKSFNS
jgi:hypothetical protein